MAKREINLALQGGGAHGAFTWGVLDRLLDAPEIEVAAISGTSAGALNGAAFKAGLVSGGREGARDNLDWLWQQVMQLDDISMAQWFAFPGMEVGAIAKVLEYSPGYAALDLASRMMSPYQYGALYQNPLEKIVSRFAWDKVCGDAGPDLFICATNVRTGKIRVFRDAEISSDVIMASACLPTLFQAVEVDDEHYWDGGYTGNPALFPLYEPAYPDDIVIVNINPLERPDVPKTPQDIQNRINEISFNTSLLRELRAVNFVKRLLAQGDLKEGAFKDVNVHMIADDALMNELSVATKLVPQPYVIAKLKEAGQRACDRFLDDHGDKIGVEGSVDLVEMFS